MMGFVCASMAVSVLRSVPWVPALPIALETLVMRVARLSGKVVASASGPVQTDALIKLIPRLSNPSLTEHEVRQMDPADLVQCGGEIAGFLLTKRAKGEAA